MSKDNGGPAFPCEGGRTVMSGNAMHKTLPSDGMTLRDYFAAKAMQGMIAAVGYHRGEVDFMADSAYDCADAMLKERAK